MWYRIPAYEALWPLLDAINAEMDAKMEQVAPTYPGIPSGACERCLDLQAAYERAVICNGELEVACDRISHELDAVHEQNAVLQQLIDQQAETIRTLKEQRDCNEHLRMDRGIYRAEGFDTAGE